MHGKNRDIIDGIKENSTLRQIRFLFSFCCVFSVVFLLFCPKNAYCYQFTLEDPNNRTVIVQVNVTPDLGKNWQHVDSEGKEYHLVAESMGKMSVIVTVTGVYQGSYEGSVTSCRPNDAGADFSGNWVQFSSSSYQLTVPEEDLLPTAENGYQSTAHLHFDFLLHYDEKIDGTHYSRSAVFNGELIVESTGSRRGRY